MAQKKMPIEFEKQTANSIASNSTHSVVESWNFGAESEKEAEKSSQNEVKEYFLDEK